jgi:hypothetical protein
VTRVLCSADAWAALAAIAGPIARDARGVSLYRGTRVQGGLRVLVFAVVALATFVGLTSFAYRAELVLLAVAAIAGLFACASALTFVVPDRDGLWIDPLFAPRRFVPYTQIAHVTCAGREVVFELVDGRQLAFHASILQEPPTVEALARAKIEQANAEREEGQRLGVAMRALQRVLRTDDRVAPPVFERAGRSTSAWLRAIASSTDLHATFRTSGFPRAKLWEIVADESGDPVARTAAAAGLALRIEADDERARLREVAARCEGTKLRVAIATIADAHDEEAIGAELEDVERVSGALRDARRGAKSRRLR